jgi:hypothetical protein
VKKKKGGVGVKGEANGTRDGLFNAIHPTAHLLKTVNIVFNGNNPGLVPGLLRCATKPKSFQGWERVNVYSANTPLLSSRHSPATTSLKTTTSFSTVINQRLFPVYYDLQQNSEVKISERVNLYSAKTPRLS